MSKFFLIIYLFFNHFSILRIGVLGQPIDALTLIVSGDAPATNTSAPQLSNVDVK
jgi:hypothetical protein